MGDLSLSTYIHAASIWFIAAQRAGWPPRRIPLEPIEVPKLRARYPSRLGAIRVDQAGKNMVAKPTTDRSGHDRMRMTPSFARFLEAAFQRWRPSLPVSIRSAEIDAKPHLSSSEIGLLVIADK